MSIRFVMSAIPSSKYCNSSVSLSTFLDMYEQKRPLSLQ